MKSRSRAAKWSVASAVTILAIGSLLPLWTIQGTYTAEEHAQGMTKPFYLNVPLWQALANIRDEVSYNVHYRWQNLILTGILAVIVSCTGYGVFRILAPRSVSEATGDYSETRTGAVKDGRAESESDVVSDDAESA